MPVKNEVNREVLEVSKVEWDDMWMSQQHLLADIVDMQQWVIYAIYKSQAGRAFIQKPKPVTRPTYGKKAVVKKEKPKSLRDLDGFFAKKLATS